MAVQVWNPCGFISTGEPGTVNESTPFLPGQLGTLVVVKNSTLFSPGQGPRVFQYIQRSSTDGTTLAAVGGVAHWANYDDFIVTQDESDALGGTGSNHVAGVFPKNVLVDGNFGFVGVGGQAAVKLLAATTAVAAATGQPVLPSATDGDADVVADWTGAARRPFAKTLSAKNAGGIGTDVIEALLMPDRNGW